MFSSFSKSDKLSLVVNWIKVNLLSAVVNILLVTPNISSSKLLNVIPEPVMSNISLFGFIFVSRVILISKSVDSLYTKSPIR